MSDFAVVALVCSAGGLDALTRVLSPLPGDLDAAVVVLQHMEPDRASNLDAILAGRTALTVAFAGDGDLLVPGRVFIAPPGQHTIVSADAGLALIASGSAPPYRPSADLLLTTMAVAYGSRVIAVVLSGKGNDAATGVTAVHRFGGTVIAATVASSAHAQMPQAAIGRDHAVGHIVPVDAVAALLVSLVESRR